MSTGTIACAVSPFAIEADHPRNCELLLASAAGVRLRSAFDGMKPAIDKQGNPHVPHEQATTFASFPRMPGMQIHVNPAKLSYKIIDPLYKDDALCERITSVIRKLTATSPNAKFTGHAPKEVENVDPHNMKTLCREMFNLVKCGEAKVVRGDLPTKDEIEQLPGYFLLNPGMHSTTTQPRYEHEFQEWIDRLSHNGG